MPASSATASRPRLSIDQTFEVAKAGGRPALMPFLPAGYPNLETTAALLPAMQTSGANLIELGFPFSDPVADGPIIQEAFTYALGRRVIVSDVFSVVRNARASVTIPIFGMLSFSIVFRYGVERFIAEAKSAGLDGLIIPDLPPPEAKKVCDTIHAGGLTTSLLVAPTTAPARRAEIARLSTGFVYYLSVSGITGERDKLPPNLSENVRAIKALTDRPVCVGFGISKPHHVQMLSGVADGAIVGSAIVRRMKEHIGAPPEAIVESVRTYLLDLMRGE
jgi:tryptophan synthase alpha chain